jgi:hypothetical protein
VAPLPCNPPPAPEIDLECTLFAANAVGGVAALIAATPRWTITLLSDADISPRGRRVTGIGASGDAPATAPIATKTRRDISPAPPSRPGAAGCTAVRSAKSPIIGRRAPPPEPVKTAMLGRTARVPPSVGSLPPLPQFRPTFPSEGRECWSCFSPFRCCDSKLFWPTASPGSPGANGVPVACDTGLPSCPDRFETTAADRPAP